MKEEEKKFPPRIRKICKLPIRGISRILDVGCGDGKYVLAFKESFGAKEAYGIDIGEKAILNGSASGIIMSSVDLNQKELPYENDYFDFVFAGEIIEHLMSPDNILSEVKRVLKPDGMFAITTPNIANWYDRFLLMFGWQPYSIPTHSVYRGVGTFLSKQRNTTIRDYRYVFTTGGCGYAHIQFFTFKSIKALLEMHGFNVVKMWGVPADQFTFPVHKAVRKMLITMDMCISNTMTSLASGIVAVTRIRKK